VWIGKQPSRQSFEGILAAKTIKGVICVELKSIWGSFFFYERAGVNLGRPDEARSRLTSLIKPMKSNENE